MIRYITSRFVQSILVLVVVLTLVFLAGRLIGNPARLILGAEARAEDVANLERRFGYDQPIPVQFARYAGGVLSGDFGNSWWQNRPALAMVIQRIPATLYLASVTVIIAMPTALVLGSIAARRPGSLADKAVSLLSLVAASIVDFWVALILILLFAVHLGWLPTSGSESFEYVILPALALSLRPIGRVSQVTRSAVLEQLAKPYVKTARAKGLGENRVVFGHMLKNASIPILTIVADEAISILNGAVVIETIFAWPGIGSLTISAVRNRDLPLIEALVFVICLMILTTNLFVDLMYSVLDPKVQYSQEGGT